MLTKQTHNLRLLLTRLGASTPAATRCPNSNLQRRGSAPIRLPNIRVVIEQDTDRRGASRANSAMERRYTGAINGIRICTCQQQKLDRLRLRVRIPTLRSRAPIARVVQGLSPSAIPCMHISPTFDEIADEVRLMRC